MGRRTVHNITFNKKKTKYIYTKEMTKKKKEAHNSGFIVNEVRYSVCRLTVAF